MAPRIRFFSLPSATLFAAVGSFLLVKTFPERFPRSNAFAWLFIQLFGFYLLLMFLYAFFYLGLIYPYLISPIRHFPRVNVSSFS